MTAFDPTAQPLSGSASAKYEELVGQLNEEVKKLKSKAANTLKVYGVIFLVLIGFCVFMGIRAYNDDKPKKIQNLEQQISKYQSDIKTLAEETTILKNRQKQYDSVSAELQQQDIDLVDLYNQNIDKIYEIKTSLSKNIDRIDRFSSPDIIGWFDGNYPYEGFDSESNGQR